MGINQETQNPKIVQKTVARPSSASSSPVIRLLMTVPAGVASSDAVCLTAVPASRWPDTSRQQSVIRALVRPPSSLTTELRFEDSYLGLDLGKVAR
jgi:hypothetical protein